MKKALYILPVIAIMLLGFSSCSNDSNLEGESNSKATDAISFTLPNPTTYAQDDTNSMDDVSDIPTLKASENEKNINNITIVLFDNNDLFVEAYTTITGTNASNLTKKDDGKTFAIKTNFEENMHYLAIANINKDFVNKIINNAGEIGLYRELVDNLHISQRDSDNFLMVSDQIETLKNSNDADANKIELIRKAYRFDVQNLSQNYFISSIDFNGRSTQTCIDAVFDESVVDTTSYDFTNKRALIRQIYGYTNTSKNSELILNYKDKTGTTFSQPIKLQFDLESNNLYLLQISDKNSGSVDPTPGDKIDISINVIDWRTGKEINYSDKDIREKIKLGTLKMR